MIIRYLFLLLFLVCCLPLTAQWMVQGHVADGATAKLLSGIGVFLSNTAVGTATREDGSFRLPPLPPGRYDLVVSAIGYETAVQSLRINANHLLPLISLQPKVNELEALVLEPYEKDGWAKWGRFFLDNFIGTSAFAG